MKRSLLSARRFALAAVGVSATYGLLSFAALEFTFDPTVTAEQADLIRGDLDYLESVRLDVVAIALPDGKDLLRDSIRMLGLPGVEPRQLKNWIGARVSSIVGETYDPEKKGSVVPTRSIVYQNPETFPDYEDSYFDIPPNANPGVVGMSNIGVSAYEYGKHSKNLQGLEIAGRVVPMTTPRFGVIQVGPGLFRPRKFEAPGAFDPRTPAHRISRLAVFFTKRGIATATGNHSGSTTRSVRRERRSRACSRATGT